MNNLVLTGSPKGSLKNVCLISYNEIGINCVEMEIKTEKFVVT